MQTELPPVSVFVQTKRKSLGLTQQALAEQTGLGYRFIREVESGKTTLRMDKVNQLLAFWGHVLIPMPSPKQLDNQ